VCDFQALRSFCYAFHLNPADEELLRDDLMWALELVNRKRALEVEQQAVNDALEGRQCVTIVELDANNDELSDKTIAVPCQEPVSVDDKAEDQVHVLPRLPPNYVVMRDSNL
jgi:hypothetical protein